MKEKIFLAGAGGFIGGHLAKELLNQGAQLVCCDVKPLDQWFQIFPQAENHVSDLKKPSSSLLLTQGCDTIYNLACDMGGMGFIYSNKALCMLSVLINTNLLSAAKVNSVKKFFFASSACVYPVFMQEGGSIVLKETDAYPAQCEDGYGWEKLFSERMCRHFFEDFDIECRIARLHNVYGPFGAYDGGREKAPAAICRKVQQAKMSNKMHIEIWGDGEQIRSFTYIDDCIEGILRLMKSNYTQPINIGSNQGVTINHLVSLVEDIAGIKVERGYKLDAPQGVRSRNCDNTLINKILDWEPSQSLSQGLQPTFEWIANEMQSKV